MEAYNHWILMKGEEDGLKNGKQLTRKVGRFYKWSLTTKFN